MTDQQLTDQHRALVLQRLAEAEQELARIATWLAQMDEDRASVALEHAWEGVAAAAWELEAPLRHRRVTRSPRPGP